MTPLDNAVLLERAGEGDQLAWNEIVERFTNLLWSIGRAHRLDESAINDIVQATWLRLLENLSRIREPERLAGWLATTARRECLQLLRRGGREFAGWDADAFTAMADEVAEPADQVMLLEERDSELWRCFRGLSTQCQQLLRVLMSVESFSYLEVSTALDVPIGSIGPTRMRCLKRLRELVVATGYPFDGASEGGAR